METSVQTNVEEKPKLVRPRTALHRYKEDGTYDRKPLSKTYFIDYYAAHKQTVTCVHCNMSFTHKNGLWKHERRNTTCRTQIELRQLRAQVEQLQAQLPPQEIV
jgi:hypothetical protein